MGNQLAQVIHINQNKEESVWNNIETWLQKNEKKSPNTAKTYEKAVRDYFSWLCKKRLEDLQPKDLITSGTLLVKYQNVLKEKYKNNTINTKMGAIRSLYKFIEEDYEEVKGEWFNKVDRLDEEEDVEQCGELYFDEVLQMMDIVKNTHKGLEKQLLIEFAVTSSFRKESILKLKWKDIIYDPIENLYLFPTYIKRNKDIKPLKPEQYERLLKLKERNKEYIFSLSPTTIQSMMNMLKQKLNIDENRNIRFHSFKNVSINFSCRVLHDLNAAQTQGGHKSYATTKKFYVKANRKLANMPGLQIWERPDYSKIDELSKEELVKIIHSCSEGTLREIVSKINS